MATDAPDSERTSAYGITVDDPGQVQLFSAEPALEVSPLTAPAVDPGQQAGEGSFDFSPGADSEVTTSRVDRTPRRR